ncbi:MAG: hypothetical protein QOE31_538 [Solirubrobacteraceae bacterium]|nr:hypothetical protein [Solirubrobacteraceae bacterium]
MEVAGAKFGKGPHVFSRRSKLRIGSTAVIALATLAVGAGSANAGVLVSSATDCDDQTLSQPFAPWLDVAQYTPLSGGDFESAAAGWALTGGSAVAGGNEIYHVAGGADASSLTIPSGGSATSPAICVGLEHPTVRFFAKRNSGGPLGLSTLRVDVLFENNLGLVNSLPIGVVSGSSSWQPTLPMTVLASLLPLLPGEHTPVAFRFTPMLGGNWSIDDIQVDPYQRR